MAFFRAKKRKINHKKLARMRAFTVPRHWSNMELAKFTEHLRGRVINVSAWEDKDKEGRYYRDYFTRCSSYWTSNFGTSQGTLQNDANEYFIDLEKPVEESLKQAFDVVFNHTTLEHIWDFRTAFANLCTLSNDIVVLVVPWLQPLHTEYGDYWRFSPQAVSRLFRENDFDTLYMSWNSQANTAVYIFAIGSRNRANWLREFPEIPAAIGDEEFFRLGENFPGARAFEPESDME